MVRLSALTALTALTAAMAFTAFAVPDTFRITSFYCPGTLHQVGVLIGFTSTPHFQPIRPAASPAPQRLPVPEFAPASGLLALTNP